MLVRGVESYKKYTCREGGMEFKGLDNTLYSGHNFAVLKYDKKKNAFRMIPIRRHFEFSK